MDGIQAVIFVVRCVEGLLLCQDVPSEHLRYSTMAACKADLPVQISHQRVNSAEPAVVMARCHYLLKKKDWRKGLDTQQIAIAP